MQPLAQCVVVLAALYLLALGVTAAVRPASAKRFLEAHASTARLHFIELSLRVVIGVALIVAAPHMRGGTPVVAGGWILVASSVVLAITPWRVHHRFAAWAVPMATRAMPLVAAGALAGGIALLSALLMGTRAA